MTWVLIAVFLNPAGGVAVEKVEFPTEDACAAAIKTIGTAVSVRGVLAGVTCISRAP